MRSLTRSCFLLLPLWKLFLLAPSFLLGTCLPSLWSPPSPLHALVLISLSLVKMRLSLTLTLSHLTIWSSEQTALFLFLLGKAAPAYLSTALSVALKPLLSFLQAQYAQIFLLKPAQFCKLFAGLGSTNKSAFSLLLLYNSRSVLTTLSSAPSFLLPQSLADLARTVFSLLFHQATKGLQTLVSPGERCC